MANENIEKKDMSLDDANRVRVLSPGMMVFKRFIRNKLAIVGIVIIVFMFLFSFVGGLLNPYSQSQVFYTTEQILKDYAGATAIDQYQIYQVDGVKLPSDIYSKTLIAASTNKFVFETRDGSLLGLGNVGEGVYRIFSLEEVNMLLKKNAAYDEAVAAGENFFVDKDGKTYVFQDNGDPMPSVYEATEMGVAAMKSFTTYEKDAKLSYEFYCGALTAVADGEKSFEADGKTYSVDGDVITDGTTEVALVSDVNFNAANAGVFISPAYKEAAMAAIEAGQTSFTFADEDGTEIEYRIENKNGQYTFRRFQETRVIDTYARPSAKHWVGTDANGMDLLARLMYGGRISLLIGFVVIFIEVFIGMIIGGIAGFFGGWVDNLLMRIVDVVYCIPTMPLYLILGSIMDYYQASATTRIYMLCVIMAVIGWVGIARIVRGQILSLREQEFMVAAEATGISTYRRIFKHLIPNVVPQLIVFASMGLGDVILAEATLSFLGLGIKYPAASWGSIINAVNDSYVMSNYVFVWLPAGVFILLTVLAFNFIGDGLRDAFDPKMKR
ncbi:MULTISPECIES: ABC transporter permease [unclassified Butyrivibrio]|uniref:ABC transporter permease n=1 Tax=unclassified Butyrivibrio TaxID=2639466 RepID=UPI0003B68EED|nr:MULTISPECIES: ABC transporter permease [unclassified Butyrivibrio]